MPDPARHRALTSRSTLLGVNILLAGALGVTTLLVSTPSPAQPQRLPAGGAGDRGPDAAGRVRGEYTMLSGRIQGSTTSAIYILDAANQELVALTWNRSANQLEAIGLRNLSDDARFLNRGR